MQLKIICLLFTLVLQRECLAIDNEINYASGLPEPYTYQCFQSKNVESDYEKKEQVAIGIQLNNRVTSQLLSRIFAIFLREVLHYENISLVKFNYSDDIEDIYYEEKKFYAYLDGIRINNRSRSTRMIDLDVWFPSTCHTKIRPTIIETGSSISTGRYGWFVPKDVFLYKNVSSPIHYELFKNPHNDLYNNFIFEDYIFEYLRNSSQYFTSKQCANIRCVILLAEYKEDTAFIINQINDMRLYLNVLWLGENWRKHLKWLYKEYKSKNSKSFIILHWRPSDIIYNERDFYRIELPDCEVFDSLKVSNCKYEMTPVLKFYADSLKNFNSLEHAMVQFKIDNDSLEALLKEVWRRNVSNSSELYDTYNHIACEWLQNNSNLYKKWIYRQRVKVSIGGLFPQTNVTRGLHNLFYAADAAAKAINNNDTLRNSFQLEIYNHDDLCKTDIVMKTVIQYFDIPMLLGILGPACSETVEPIAGISKHMRMTVMSYSAEGSSFEKRSEYPYFFRTIGSNRQYEDAYIALMKQLGWSRIAALTEDGEKYSEYISHMENEFKQNDLELLINKKLSSDVGADGMYKNLADIKNKHVRIIIADFPDYLAELAMCAAFKLKMTAKHGYIWFLPSWLAKSNTFYNVKGNESCTDKDLKMAFDGHFSMLHTPFGKNNTIMQEGISIEQWRYNFFKKHPTTSNYVGFAYDAVWAYALAAHKLLDQNPSALHNLREHDVVEQFKNILWNTSFTGLSGDVRFGLGGSRITDLDIVQWRDSKYYPVGKFKPKIKKNLQDGVIYPKGGYLTLDEKNIVWLSNSNPGDGKYDCNFSLIAKWLNEDCDTATIFVTCIICLFVILFVSIVSFWFWKHRYDKKLKRSAKIMKNFGIDILSPSKSKINTLDKWEIPKENVVVNRRLGEGAFGTVYGGEAQIGADGWTAVAVKTLKVEASSEDRLDFLSEAEAMKRFDHKNIVKLLGVCLQSDPIYTIMEFMLYGDLKTYLLARRHLVNDKVHEDSDVSPKRLTMYATDIARGLEYLTQQKYVHRDIACRNCLVNAQRVVKLGDFGMSRPIYGSDYYRFNRKGMLPVRWMAPEALALGYFTPASDIWSYGVVLYEIITFGSFPFQGLTNNQVVDHVKNGNTLKMPLGVKPQLEGLIKACWNSDPKKRPSALDVIIYIANYPRLISPCLDFPAASVEMSDTGIDEFEILIKNQGLSLHRTDSKVQIVPDKVDSNSQYNDLNGILADIELEKNDPITQPTTFNRADNCTESFTPTTPDGYSIMSPLLLHQAGISPDISQTSTNQQTPF